MVCTSTTSIGARSNSRVDDRYLHIHRVHQVTESGRDYNQINFLEWNICLVSLHLEVVTADSPQIINNNPVEIWARPFAGQQRRPAVQDLGGFSYEKYLIVFNCGQFGINSDKWICPAIMSPALRPTLAEHFNKEEIFEALWRNWDNYNF